MSCAKRTIIRRPTLSTIVCASACRGSVWVPCIAIWKSSPHWGEIQTLELSGTQKRYDGIPGKHYHIRCLHCGRLDDAPIAPLSRLEDELYESTVYTIMGHRLEFMGLCPECSKDHEARHIAEAAIAASEASTPN
jgi:hypothetical protein